ncbi:hypothetical protein CORC01_07981 [Colletotrichum orchidophilum]|uniref:Centromere protein Scm3 n=1 Tax=Colletotrichum orchidophilum TaxID=1209926 RepID=A0A1G4B5I3_9PEZI|nr:uncharacterized protein CORC01_07981 [Colletotrichum orchidophilum]OHE96664.1 hypothetical protein CORC01_07981 [Colletotrichum orchidophilum]
MEPPAKRPKTGPSSLDQQSKEDEDDELNYEPEEVSRMRDPGFRFEQSRAFAAFKLKSTFEHIFQKYDKDFTGIGDEIDLRTGKIITNNGHLEGMRNERDTGILDGDDEEDEGVLLEEEFASDDDEEDDGSGSDVGDEDGIPDASDTEDDEELILHGRRNEESHSKTVLHIQKGELQRHPSLSNAPPTVSRPRSDHRLSSLAQPRRPESSTSNSSSNIWGREPDPVDPTWRVPEIDKPKLGDDLMTRLYGARYRFPASRGFQSVWSSRPDTDLEKALPEPAQIDMKQLIRVKNEIPRMARPMSKKLLQAFTDQDDDNEDDILGVATADRELRIAKKSSDNTDPISDEAVLITVEENRQGLEPSTRDEPSNAKTAGSKALSREIGWLVENKTSVSDGSRPRRQLIPTKVIKPIDVPKPKDMSKLSQSTETQVQRQLPIVPTEVEAEADPSLMSLVKDRDLRNKPKQRFVIELFSKMPSPEEITMVEDPEDMDTFDSVQQHEALTPQLANLTVSEATPKSLVQQQSHEAGVTEKPTLVESAAEKNVESPGKNIVRHKIDPSYDFSDDEEGIPTTRIRNLRVGRRPVAIPATVELASPIEEARPEISKTVFMSEDHQSSRIEPNDGSLLRSEPATPESSGIGIATSDQPADAPAEARDEQSDRRLGETCEATAGINNATTIFSAENSTELSHTTEQLLIEAPNAMEVEVPSHSAALAVQEPQNPNNAKQNTPPYATQAETQKEPQEGTQEGTRDGIQEETQKSPQSETEENQKMDEPQQEKENEDIEPFTIPLGLDVTDETSAHETETDPEATEIELPILPPQPRGSLLAPPLRRKHSSGSTEPSEVVGKTATSPFKHMNLQSSSPLKKYAVTKSSAKSRKAVNPRASARPERRRAEPRSRKRAGQTTASTLDISDSSTTTTSAAALHPSPHREQRRKTSPSTPSSSRHQLRITKDSTSRKSFISLLSDDEDELTLDLFKTWMAATPSGGGSSAERRRTSYTPFLLAGPQTKITTPMKQKSLLASGSGSAGAVAGTGTARGKKRKAAWAFATPTRVHFGSPSGSFVQTPGGNMRRCGEDGFRCDRDFCFTCL